MTNVRLQWDALVTIEEWRPEPSASRLKHELDGLAEVLHACVHAGASVSFILPFTLAEALDFWQARVLPSVLAGERRVLIAHSEEQIAGTVQLILGLPPNQQHRAEVAKLLVHPDVRRRGIGHALMERLETIAQSEGRTLLTLDTRTGDSAEPLYHSIGYQLAGVIPGYARGPASPDLEPTSFMYKHLLPLRST